MNIFSLQRRWSKKSITKELFLKIGEINQDYNYKMNLDKIHLKSVHIIVNLFCNLECDMCDDWQVKDFGLSLDLIKKFLKEARQLGAKQVDIIGGEPLMREDFLEIIKFAYDLGYLIWLSTNGSLIDEKKAKALSHYVNGISISVEGVKSCHDYIRGHGSYDKAISAVKLLGKYKNLVVLNMVVSKYSYHYMKDLIDLADRLGINSVAYHPFTKRDLWLRRENWDRYIIANEQIGDLKRRIEETVSYAGEKGVKIDRPYIMQKIPDFFKFNESVFPKNGCLIPLHTLFLYPSGEVVACGSLTHFKIGNIKNSVLKDIWHSIGYTRIRTIAKQKKCSGCLSACTDSEQYVPHSIYEASLKNRLKRYFRQRIMERIERFKYFGWRYVKKGIRRKLLRRIF